MDDREAWLARTFVELADTLVADFDVIDFMSTLVERCAELLGSAEVGLALSATRGELRVMASSSERMRSLELIESQNDEGPCRDCLRSGEQVLNQRMEGAEARWPRFVPEAREAGIEMVHALPLRLRSDVIGAMNIFSTEQIELAPEDVNLTQALADAATIGILQERAIKHGADLGASSKAHSLADRHRAGQGDRGREPEGRHGGSLRHAPGTRQDQSRPLSDIARAVTARSLAPAELRAAGHRESARKPTP